MRFNPANTLISLALLAAIAAAPAAQAADLPNRGGYAGPVLSNFSWGGFYAGAHLGYGFGKARNADIDGFLGGVQAGVNFQQDKVVFGGELDASYSGIDFRGFTDRFRQRWLISARGRLGYAVDRFLPYITAGIAHTSATIKAATGKADNGHVGFVVGLGGEAMVTDRISARVEFLHYRFDSQTYDIPAAARRTGITTNTVRIGMNYRF